MAAYAEGREQQGHRRQLAKRIWFTNPLIIIGLILLFSYLTTTSVINPPAKVLGAFVPMVRFVVVQE